MLEANLYKILKSYFEHHVKPLKEQRRGKEVVNIVEYTLMTELGIDQAVAEIIGNKGENATDLFRSKDEKPKYINLLIKILMRLYLQYHKRS